MVICSCRMSRQSHPSGVLVGVGIVSHRPPSRHQQNRLGGKPQLDRPGICAISSIEAKGDLGQVSRELLDRGFIFFHLVRQLPQFRLCGPAALQVRNTAHSRSELSTVRLASVQCPQRRVQFGVVGVEIGAQDLVGGKPLVQIIICGLVGCHKNSPSFEFAGRRRTRQDAAGASPRPTEPV